MGYSRDQEAAARHVAVLAGAGESVAKIVQRMDTRADALLDSNWPLVEAVADRRDAAFIRLVAFHVANLTDPPEDQVA